MMMTRHLPLLALCLVSCVQAPLQKPAPPSMVPEEIVQQTPLPSPRASSSDTTFITIPWRLLGQTSQALNNGATLHEMQFTSLDAGDVDLSLISFNSQTCTLRVIDQPNPNAGSNAMGDLMIAAGAVAGVNGGYFHPDFSTLGHLIVGGRRLGSFTRSSLASGMIRVMNRSPALIWSGEYQGDAGVSDLIQCGPRLVDGGEPISGLNNAKTSARTFIATDGGQHWLIGVARYTTLRALSDLLATPHLVLGLRIDRALNLDGGRSTAIYARRSDGSEVNDPGWSTVRNYLAVVPR